MITDDQREPLDVTDMEVRHREARERHGLMWDQHASLVERDRGTLLDEIQELRHDSRKCRAGIKRQNEAMEWIRTFAGGGGPLPSNWTTPWRDRAEAAEQKATARQRTITAALGLLDGGSLDQAVELLRSTAKENQGTETP